MSYFAGEPQFGQYTSAIVLSIKTSPARFLCLNAAQQAYRVFVVSVQRFDDLKPRSLYCQQPRKVINITSYFYSDKRQATIMALFSGIPDSKKRVLLFMAALSVGSTVAFQGWAMLYNNFAVNVAGLDPTQNGVLQALREIPGLITVSLIVFLFVLKEHQLMTCAVAAAGLGTLLTGLFPSSVPMICTSFLMSLGVHYFESLNNSLCIQHFDLRQTPLVMGRLRSFVAAGSLLISAFVFFASDKLDFRWLFFVPGAAAILLAVAGSIGDPLGGSRSAAKQKRRALPQKRYWLFYLLNFIMGARRQIFTVFSVFLMVEQFGFSVRTVSLLYMFNFAVNWLFNPLVGVIINKLGERRLLSIEYGAAILIFAGYAYTDSTYLLVLLYALDSLTFNFEIAVRTFFQKIAFAEDAAPNMAIAQSINHIPAVTFPALGGWMWQEFGYRSVFLTGAAVTLLSLLAAQLIDREIRLKSAEARGQLQSGENEA